MRKSNRSVAISGALLLVACSGPRPPWAVRDDAAVTSPPARAAPTLAIHGRVLDARDTPVAGAVVAAVDPAATRPSEIVTTGADGAFAFALRPGPWAFTATSPRGVAAYQDVRELAGTADVQLRLADSDTDGDGRDDDIVVSGVVRVEGAAPPDLRVLAYRVSNLQGDIFAGEVGRGGTFALRLPRADGYWFTLGGRGLRAPSRQVAGDRDGLVDLDGVVPAPAPAAVVDWLRTAAAPLAGVDPALPTDDLRALHPLVDGARLIAFGEATHGTREFFQLKHRALAYLVEHEGVRWFAIEASMPEARAVDAYVTRGEGTAAAALAGMYFWTWDTEEVLAMIEWMRAYNADARHAGDPVHFAGFDMQFTQVAWPSVTAYLARVDAAAAAALPARLAILGEKDVRKRWPSLPAEERAAVRADVAALAARFDAQRSAWAADDTDAYELARQDLRVVEQALAMYEGGDAGGFEARDRAMADNVDWLLARAHPGAPMMLWAHNGHVGREHDDLANMGSLLAARHAAAYRPIGFVFGEGGFQAMGAPGGGLGEVVVGPPAPEDVASAFRRADRSLAVVDLRGAPAAVDAWLHAGHAMRELGSTYLDDAGLVRVVHLAREFDAVVYVDRTTRARPTPTGRRDAPR